MSNDNSIRGGRLLVAGALAFLSAFFFAMTFMQPLSTVEVGIAFGLLALLLLVISTGSGSDDQ